MKTYRFYRGEFTNKINIDIGFHHYKDMIFDDQLIVDLFMFIDPDKDLYYYAHGADVNNSALFKNHKGNTDHKFDPKIIDGIILEKAPIYVKLFESRLGRLLL